MTATPNPTERWTRDTGYRPIPLYTRHSFDPNWLATSVIYDGTNTDILWNRVNDYPDINTIEDAA